MEHWLAISPWRHFVMILYISDYYLTIYSARGFRETGHFQFEDSLELTPQYQKDVNAFKPISKLHFTLLVLYSLLIIFIWWFTRRLPYFPWTYLLYLGMFLLLEVGIHLRHLRNISLIRAIRSDAGGVEGQIKYRKWFSYKISVSEFYIFSALFLVIAILAYSPFFLGGSIMCFGQGFKHSRLAKKTKTDAQAIQSG